ncbi:MAG: 16S rRNA (cytosine(1402)-N(4))-methyltransferase RsmH [Planctomycetes bacterium]|nr:16S rRNA (cytosine(1402)-N(4))-methyltransferase RsmH [Planctomycetota bacterium]
MTALNPCTQVTIKPSHIPVLAEESLRLLAIRPGSVYVDCTAGLGGHAAAAAVLLGPTGTVVLNDLDPSNLEVAQRNVQERCPGVRVVSFRGNFADAPRRMAETGLKADSLLADLGFASPHVDNPERGFSFMHDGPLDMRMDPSGPLTAADLVASLSERDLAKLIAEFGEDRAAGRIARKIVQERTRGPIKTTARLAEIVRSAAAASGSGIDPATKTFQALRIAVNDEIGSLAALLAAIVADGKRLLRGVAGDFLNPGATIGFIAFHSLEDRPVKRAFAELIAAGAADVSDGHVAADEQGVSMNPRARSAKLRVIRFGTMKTDMTTEKIEV